MLTVCWCAMTVDDATVEAVSFTDGALVSLLSPQPN
jgi:hypothetical protein